MAAKLPTSITLVAATATPVTVDGVYSELQVSVHPGGATVWVRGDGTASSTVGSNDGSYPVFPSPDEGTCIPTSGGTIASGTTISLISTGTPTVTILPCNCD